ncbi:unnamed protein product [Caenorhabditis auriculariae]|uniref:Galectin n=1 Tax=Caenorhabditis auriculariae TaxID=2777116 RepID=A0A8S1GTD9_9PELO|nr:unnamed protein product [Caenorhabditis auriculariae]
MYLVKVILALSLASLVHGRGSVCYETENTSDGYVYASFDRYLRVGDTITVYAFVKPGFSLSSVCLYEGDCLISDKTNIAIMIMPNYYMNLLSFDSFLNLRWVHSEYAFNPISGTNSFKMRIDVTEQAYLIYVDDRYIYSFAHRNPSYSAVKSLLMDRMQLNGPLTYCGRDHLSRIRSNDRMNVTISNNIVQTNYFS